MGVQVTIRQLIEELKHLPDLDKPVYFAHPAHDHWRNTLVTEVTEVGQSIITPSDYHRSLKLVPEHREPDEDAFEGIVLS